MKPTRLVWVTVWLCMAVLLLAGCGAKEPAWDTFEGALNEKSFPVPQEADSPDRTTTNVAMDYVRYTLPGLKETQGIPEPYLEAIQAWGWKEQEQKEDDKGASRIFQKEKQIVHLTVHNDYFIIMVPKEKKVSIKGLETK